MELKKVLERIPDPRGRQGRDYRLWSILGLILVSMLCGRRGMKAAFLLGELGTTCKNGNWVLCVAIPPVTRR